MIPVKPDWRTRLLPANRAKRTWTQENWKYILQWHRANLDDIQRQEAGRIGP